MKLKPLPHKLLNRYRGKQFYRFYVVVSQSSINHRSEIVLPIIAPSATDAVNAIRDEYWGRVSYPTEFEVAGPKGGITHRFIGWESAVAGQMFATRPDATQLALFRN